MAYRSLRSLRGFADFTYDFVAPPRQRFDEAARAMTLWRSMPRVADRRADRELLFDAAGTPNMDLLNRLLRQRDNRTVLLRE